MDLHRVIRSQYGASLAMLEEVIRACPASDWDDSSHRNRFWRIAYHTLFYADFYLSESEQRFSPWERAQPEANFLGPLPWPPHRDPQPAAVYSPGDLLEYAGIIRHSLGQRIDATPFDAPSGFPWLPFDRLELHVYSIRHIQHHAGQLIERLRWSNGTGVDWVGHMP